MSVLVTFDRKSVNSETYVGSFGSLVSDVIGADPASCPALTLYSRLCPRVSVTLLVLGTDNERRPSRSNRRHGRGRRCASWSDVTASLPGELGESTCKRDFVLGFVAEIPVGDHPSMRSTRRVSAAVASFRGTDCPSLRLTLLPVGFT